tara:strand:- start:326 stop:3730 length:3405 start_codon:yes stop_codon:yes gene_type:complete
MVVSITGERTDIDKQMSDSGIIDIPKQPLPEQDIELPSEIKNDVESILNQDTQQNINEEPKSKEISKDIDEDKPTDFDALQQAVLDSNKSFEGTPIDMILQLGYLMRSKVNPGNRKPSIINTFDEASEFGKRAVMGFWRNALGAEPVIGSKAEGTQRTLDPTKDAWCAAFIDHILRMMDVDRLKSSDKFNRIRAHQYVNYGTPVKLEDIREGDIIIWDLNKEKGGADAPGDHVTFYAGNRIGLNPAPEGYLNIVGGNHDNTISIREGGPAGKGVPLYNVNNIVAIRRITKNDITVDFTKFLAENDPIFKPFIPEKTDIKPKPVEFNMDSQESSLNRSNISSVSASSPSVSASVDGMSEGGMPKKQYTTNPFKAPETVKRMKSVASSLPVVGTAMSIKEIKDELAKENPDYKKVSALIAGEAVGLLPGGGTIAKTAVRQGAKQIADKSKKVDKEMISVFPKPERMFPKGDAPKGGDYLNPQTGEVLSGRNVSSANIKISPDGKPSFKVSNDNVETVGSIGKGKTKIKTNLFKKKAGWKWTNSPEGYEDIPTLVSVEKGGKHFYTLETDFSKGVNLKKYENSKTEPRLRPTVNGELEFGNQIGTISVRGKEHPVYEKIIAFKKGGAVMDKQMEMAFMQEGGMKDDGKQRDPVSGNPIPPGSMANEVRDDIPAMLSEGEYVVPADVLRFYGVNFFEGLRNKAKTGLQRMEQNGRIGGEPLSQEQVARNMQLTSPNAKAPANVPMAANTGPAVLPQTQSGALNQAQQMAQNFNPMNYSTVGFSKFKPQQSAPAAPQTIITSKTFVNAETGETRAIEYINGNLRNPADEQFTKPPFYEMGSAALKQAQDAYAGTQRNDDDDSKPAEEVKPWYEDVDWSDPNKSVNKYFGTGTKLGTGVAGAVTSMVLGPLGGVAANYGIKVSNLSTARAEMMIREAAGDTEGAAMLQAAIEKELGKSKLLGVADKAVDSLFGSDGDVKTANYLKSIGIDIPDSLNMKDPFAMKGFLSTITSSQRKLIQNATGINADAPIQPPIQGGNQKKKNEDDDPSTAPLTQQREKTKEAGKKAKESFDNYMETKGKEIMETGTEDQKAAISRTKSVIEDMERGVQRGFTKGGLMAKKKKPTPKKRATRKTKEIKNA